MNTVTNKKYKIEECELSIPELLAVLRDGCETAFMGKVMPNDEYELFLITYESIVRASRPISTWSGNQITFYVKEFVDVNMEIVYK